VPFGNLRRHQAGIIERWRQKRMHQDKEML
jgi:hypothetical protein